MCLGKERTHGQFPVEGTPEPLGLRGNDDLVHLPGSFAAHDSRVGEDSALKQANVGGGNVSIGNVSVAHGVGHLERLK